MLDDKEAWAAAAAFAVPGDVAAIGRLGGGLINDTFLVTAGFGERFVLQRINARVFADPERIQANLRILMDHAVRQGPDCGLSLPRIVLAADGRDFHRTPAGAFWRMMSFIDDTESVERVGSAYQARELGAALGRFHALFASLAPDRLYDTLPGFHVAPRYLAAYDDAWATAGKDLVAETEAWRPFIEARRHIVPLLEEARRDGAIGLRVVHGDPKLANVLFDKSSGRAVSLIDLDTVKPGLLHTDIGDCLRSACNRAGENAEEAVEFDLDLCHAVLDGYFEQAGATLSEADIDFLYEAIRLLPFELGLRFLTDHLQGNRYFRVSAPAQNLSRAAVQFGLVASIERQRSSIETLCRELWERAVAPATRRAAAPGLPRAGE